MNSARLAAEARFGQVSFQVDQLVERGILTRPESLRVLQRLAVVFGAEIGGLKTAVRLDKARV